MRTLRKILSVLILFSLVACGQADTQNISSGPTDVPVPAPKNPETPQIPKNPDSSRPAFRSIDAANQIYGSENFKGYGHIRSMMGSKTSSAHYSSITPDLSESFLPLHFTSKGAL